MTIISLSDIIVNRLAKINSTDEEKRKMNIINDMKNTKLSDGQCGIWYLGQEGFLFSSKEDFVLVDPYLSSWSPYHGAIYAITITT